jgi:hypothetical protein
MSESDPLAMTLVSSTVANIVNDIFTFVKKNITKKIEENDFYDNLYNNLRDYHIIKCRHLNNIKTFLFDANTVSFRDVYYPIAIKEKERRIIPSSFYKELNKEVDKIFDKTDKGKELLGHLTVLQSLTKSKSPHSFTYNRIYKYNKSFFKDNRFITIIGTAGSGKTMLTNHIFLSALEDTELLPFIIEFRKLSLDKTIYEYIKDTIFNFGLNKQEEEVYINILKSGKFLFILDGFDEIKRNELEHRYKDIEDFTRRFADNTYVLTSRPGVQAEYLPHFNTYSICNLTNEDILPFIKQQCKHIYDGDILEEDIKEKIANKKVDDAYSEYFKNPLLLTLFIKTYKRFPELPKNKCDFYGNVFETLWATHDSITKPGGYTHPKSYEKSTYETILYNFSFNTFFQDLYVYDEKELKEWLEESIKQSELDCNYNEVKKDLISSISIMIQDGNLFSFQHRSLQEYFAAKFISTLTPSNKELFYKEIKNNNYDIHHLLTLLSEIDKYSLYKFYFLPELTDFDKKIKENGSLPNEVLNSFAKILKVDFCFTNNKYSMFFRDKSMLPFLFQLSIIERVIETLLIVFSQVRINKKYYEMYNKGLITGFSNEQIDKLKKNGFDVIFRLYNSIIACIEKINKYIETKDKKIVFNFKK